MISQVINRKLSIEYLLKLSNRFENLKKIVLSDPEYKNFENIPPKILEEQMKELELNYKI